MKIWLNGSFVDRDEAMISVFDAGFQHGVGLFETMLARNGRVFRPDAHLARLRDSAEDLLLSKRLRPRPLAEAVQLTISRNELVVLVFTHAAAIASRRCFYFSSTVYIGKNTSSTRCKSVEKNSVSLAPLYLCPTIL